MKIILVWCQGNWSGIPGAEDGYSRNINHCTARCRFTRFRPRDISQRYRGIGCCEHICVSSPRGDGWCHCKFQCFNSKPNFVCFFRRQLSKWSKTLLAVFQGEMQYRIVGNYPSPDFFGINQRTGVVFVSRDLRLDSLQLSSYTVSSVSKN